MSILRQLWETHGSKAAFLLMCTVAGIAKVWSCAMVMTRIFHFESRPEPGYQASSSGISTLQSAAFRAVHAILRRGSNVPFDVGIPSQAHHDTACAVGRCVRLLVDTPVDHLPVPATVRPGQCTAHLAGRARPGPLSHCAQRRA